MIDLSHVTTWVFDMDDTLYPREQGLIDDGVATGGMIPKLETAMAAVRAGVEAVVILDGRRPHAMLVELFTETGAGTLVKAS